MTVLVMILAVTISGCLSGNGETAVPPRSAHPHGYESENGETVDYGGVRGDADGAGNYEGRSVAK